MKKQQKKKRGKENGSQKICLRLQKLENTTEPGKQKTWKAWRTCSCFNMAASSRNIPPLDVCVCKRGSTTTGFIHSSVCVYRERKKFLLHFHFQSPVVMVVGSSFVSLVFPRVCTTAYLHHPMPPPPPRPLLLHSVALCMYYEQTVANEGQSLPDGHGSWMCAVFDRRGTCSNIWNRHTHTHTHTENKYPIMFWSGWHLKTTSKSQKGDLLCRLPPSENLLLIRPLSFFFFNRWCGIPIRLECIQTRKKVNVTAVNQRQLPEVVAFFCLFPFFLVSLLFYFQSSRPCSFAYAV